MFWEQNKFMFTLTLGFTDKATVSLSLEHKMSMFTSFFWKLGKKG